VVTVPVGEDTQETQQLPQNDNDHENEEKGNDAEGEDDEDYTPLSDAKKDKTYHDADEIKTSRNEAMITTIRLRDLLNCLDITTPPEFRIKRVLGSGRVEYKAIVEILNESNLLSRHKGPAFRATCHDVVAGATRQAVTPSFKAKTECISLCVVTPYFSKKNSIL
jgi:hypothetical protein